MSRFNAYLALIEGWRSVIARPWRLVLGALLVGGTLGTPAVIEATTLDRALVTIHQEERAGSRVLVVSSERGTLAGQACEALNVQPGVVAAGSASSPTVIRLDSGTRLPFRSIAATAGYLRIMGLPVPSSRERAAIVGTDAAKEIGLSDSTVVPMSGVPTVFRMAEHPTRAEERGRWVTVLASPPVQAPECWVEATSASFEAVKTLIPVALGATEPLRVDLLRSEAVTERTIQAWLDRPSRWLPLAAGIGGGIVLCALLAVRRHEYALYRVIGLSRLTVAVAVLLEVFVFSTLAAALAVTNVVCWGALLGLHLTPDSAAISGGAILVGFAGVLSTASLGGILLTLGNTTTMMRNRG